MSKQPKYEAFLRRLHVTCEKCIADAEGEIEYQHGNALNAAKHGRTNDQIVVAQNIGTVTGSRDAFKFVLDLVGAELVIPPSLAAQTTVQNEVYVEEIDAEEIEAAYARHEAGKPYPQEENF